MIIKNGIVFQEDGSFLKKDLYIEKGRIIEDPVQLTDNCEVDASGLYVLPGLIDIHSHGAMGYDFSDGNTEGLKKILRYEYAHGVTSYCPTSMTIEKEKLQEIFSSMEDWQDQQDMSHVAGINMEGPFLDESKKGAHRRECIRLVTLAPNTENAMEFIRELKDETVISLGHTAADYETAREALRQGACHVTHLYNAMMPLGHRAPGLIGAASEDDNCVAELICDGIHIHESMVRAAFRLFPGRIALISDSMRATGMENGSYDLGGQRVTVNGGLATLEDGTIAGSATNLFDGMRNAVSFGIPLEDAITAATMVPAKSIGIFDDVGSLTPGKRGDVILVDKDLNLVKVIS